MCSSVAEVPGRRASRALREDAGELGFQVERVSIEAEGLCPTCAEQAA
jgi:Fur family zinc uptake transcriptional regulator